MICLRDYQKELISGIYMRYNAGQRRVIAALATGGGKSVIGAKVGQDCADKGGRMIWTVHRRELVTQAADHLVNAGLDPALIMAGEDGDLSKPVQVASIQTLIRRKPPPADLIIDDEVHHSASASHVRVLESYPDAFWLGLSATPCRLDGKGLGAVGWQGVANGPDARWLIDNGYLAPYDYWAPDEPSMKGVRSSMGDYASGQAAETMNVIVGRATKWYRKFLRGRQAICFCVTVEQSRKVAQDFIDLGIPAVHADAKTPAKEREAVMDSFRSGEIRILSNVRLVDEGFDVPECDGAIIMRPTKSLVFHRQACGRALRPKKDGRNAVIIDMAGNATRLGLPCAPVDWTLDGAKSGDSVAPIKTCKECYAVVAASARACPRCGTVFPKTDRRLEPRVVDGKLKLLKGDPAPEVQLKLEEAYWDELTRARDYGWKIMAARLRFQKRTRRWPTRKWGWVRHLEDLATSTCEHRKVNEKKLCRFCGLRASPLRDLL